MRRRIRKLVSLGDLILGKPLLGDCLVVYRGNPGCRVRGRRRASARRHRREAAVTTDRMLKFVGTAKHMPEKRPAHERAQAFGESYAAFSAHAAAEQAGRCSPRAEESRERKECVSTCRSGWTRSRQITTT